MIKDTKTIVAISERLTAGKITPLMLAPGKSYAEILNPGRKLIRAKTKAIFKINVTRPKVNRFIGKSTIENKGFTIWKISTSPPTKNKRFLGSNPNSIVGTSI